MSTLNLEVLQPFRDAASEAGIAFDIDPNLILAIIWQESAGRADAIRFEKGYFNNALNRTINVSRFAALNHISEDTEEALQCFSYGPMQVMGAMARRLGCKDPLTSLLSIDLGVFWGVKLLVAGAKQGAPIEDMIATYNHGNAQKDASGKYIVQGYVDDVMSYLKQIKGPS